MEGLRALVSERARASVSKSYWAPPFPPPPGRSSRASTLDPARGWEAADVLPPPP